MIETTRLWVLRPRVSHEFCAQFPTVPSLVMQLLHNRGVVDSASVEAFLEEKPRSTADPLLMKGVRAAVARLGRAADRGEKVAVYGDFDVDGITAAALLREGLAAVGIAARVFIPDRADGYGLNRGALGKLADEGIKLVVTVDCGISSAGEVAYAKERGLEVVVTDHHRIDGDLPDAVAVINPRQSDCGYPFKELAAVGVAYKLVQAVLEGLPLCDGHKRAAVAGRLIELVALGTVADVAPLTGENRALVRHGLRALNETKRPGLSALILQAGLRRGALNAGHIGFALAPRLNAAGRMQEAEAAYRLLATESEEEARVLVHELELANQARQRATSQCLDHARALVLAGGALQKMILVSGENYPNGVIGLVAGRLVEEFHRPAFVVALGADESRGSARGLEHFNVAEALGCCEEILLRFGGHAQAAGFTLASKDIPELQRRLLEVAERTLDDGDLQPRLMVDAEVSMTQVDDVLCDYLERLAPFGAGNPVPTFLTRGVRVVSTSVVGRETPFHLKLVLHDGERHWPAIAFRMGHNVPQVASAVDIVYTLVWNEWQGRRTLELHVKDWRPAT